MNTDRITPAAANEKKESLTPAEKIHLANKILRERGATIDPSSGCVQTYGSRYEQQRAVKQARDRFRRDD